MKRFFVFIVAIILLSGMPESAEANSSQAYKVGTSSLNVRNAPQINAEVIGSIPRGSTVQVYEKKYGWAKVVYNGRTGWVASTYLFRTS